MNRRIWQLTLLALLAPIAFGQSSSPGSTGFWSVSAGGMSGPPAVTRAPYSAEEYTENVHTLADGTHITHKSTAHVYRDSAGRTRTERTMLTTEGDGPDVPVTIEIFDPAAHVHYMLDARRKVAHKRVFASREGGPPMQAGPGPRGVLSAGPLAPPTKTRESSGARGPQATTEQLETQTMEGVLVEGSRRTLTWPAGSMGNDRPITSITERWRSPELQVVILSKTTDDPRRGDVTQKLTNISRSEPDPRLFQIPADYTVTEDRMGARP